MMQQFFYLILGSSLILSCKDEPTSPEMNCHLDDHYNLVYHAIDAEKIFDLREDPPKEIRNGKIEYALTGHWFFYHNADPAPHPYPEFFIDTILFLDSVTAEVYLFESEIARNYTVARNDCGIDLTSSLGDLHLELTQGGNELTEQRFYIFDHRKKHVTVDSQSFVLDSFTFIEYRLGPFSSYEEIIQQFAKDNPGQYDTVGIELVKNRTRE